MKLKLQRAGAVKGGEMLGRNMETGTIECFVIIPEPQRKAMPLETLDLEGNVASASRSKSGPQSRR